MTGRLLTIGRFAQLTGLTVRALRLYDEMGLLTPDTVDGSSRYRYYASDQFARADQICRLRRLDLPLEEIERFLAADRDRCEAILHAHHERLLDRIVTTERALQETEESLKELRMPVAPAQLMPIERKTVPDQPVMRIRWTLTETSVEEYPLGRHYAEINAVIDRQGLTAVGPPYCICSQSGADGTACGEAGIPVAMLGHADGTVEPAVLRGGEVVSSRYTGPTGVSGDGAAATRNLWSQIDEAGLIAYGDPRWIYLSKPTTPPDHQIAELAWPIR